VYILKSDGSSACSQHVDRQCNPYMTFVASVVSHDPSESTVLYGMSWRVTFWRSGIVTSSPNPIAGGPLLVGSPLAFCQYNSRTPSHHLQAGGKHWPDTCPDSWHVPWYLLRGLLTVNTGVVEQSASNMWKRANLITHSLTHSLTHLLPYSLTYLLTH